MPDAETVAQQKEGIGWIVTWMWILTGCYSYLTTTNHSLLSLSAFIFIFGGAFVAAGLLGLTYWLVAQGIAMILRRLAMRRLQKGEPVPQPGILPQLFFVMEIVITIVVARVAFHLVA